MAWFYPKIGVLLVETFFFFFFCVHRLKITMPTETPLPTPASVCFSTTQPRVIERNFPLFSANSQHSIFNPITRKKLCPKRTDQHEIKVKACDPFAPFRMLIEKWKSLFLLFFTYTPTDGHKPRSMGRAERQTLASSKSGSHFFLN